LIVGAMRSGTTSLSQYLRAHPEVFVVPQKELYFFDSEIWDRGPEWYRACFADADDAIAVGEASPDYMYEPSAPARMASVVPHAKLIAILRNPVDRAYSHYSHARNRKGTEQRSFAAAVEAEVAGDDPSLYPGYVAHGHYLAQLRRLLNHYPREAMLVLLLDDLEASPVETFASVCRFLGVDDSIAPPNLGAVENAYLEHRAYRLWRFMNRHQLWRRLPRREAIARSMLRVGVDPPPLDPELHARLVAHFAEPNTELGEWLGRDLSHWNVPSTKRPSVAGRAAAQLRAPPRRAG
jgi:hypothetical protein